MLKYSTRHTIFVYQVVILLIQTVVLCAAVVGSISRLIRGPAFLFVILVLFADLDWAQAGHKNLFLQIFALKNNNETIRQQLGLIQPPRLTPVGKTRCFYHFYSS